MSDPREGTLKRRVLIVHAGSLLGEGISSWLHSKNELEVTVGCCPKRMTVEWLESLRPQVIVLDDAALASSVESSLLRFVGAHPEVQLIALELQTSRLTVLSGRRVVARAAGDLLAAIGGQRAPDVVDGER